MKSQQLRLRIPSEIASKLRGLPIPVRNQLIAIMLRAQLDKIDLALLCSMRREMGVLGALLNQSLRTSWGAETNRQAAELVVTKLQNFFKA